MDIVKQILDAARVIDVMEETDESMEVSGDLSEHSGTLHATGSQTGHNTLESSKTLIKPPDAHPDPTLISQDTRVNSVPIDDWMKTFMGDGEELQNQSYMSSELQVGTHDEGNQTQENQDGESTFGNFQTVLNKANPPPSHLQYLGRDGYLGALTLSFSGLMEASEEDQVPITPISQYDEAAASLTEEPIGNQSTGVNAEQILQKNTPSISGVCAESMEASEEEGSDADGLPDLADKEERRKMKNREASGKSRKSARIRNENLLSEMHKLDQDIELLEQQHRLLQENHENAKTSARHRNEFISIGHYLEVYVMPLLLKYSLGNEAQDESPVLITEEVNEEEEKLEVPSVRPAPERHVSPRRPRANNINTVNEKRSNKDASKRYRDQEHKYWKAIEERIEKLRTKLNVLKRKISYFQVCEGKRFSKNELRKSILRRQYIVPGLDYDKFTKLKIAGWFYTVGLTEDEFGSLFEENRYLTLPISSGCFICQFCSEPDENILLLDFSPYRPSVSDMAPY